MARQVLQTPHRQQRRIGTICPSRRRQVPRIAKRYPQQVNGVFSAKYTDAETGLVYYGYRYYQPSTGKWTNYDPLGESGGNNLYRAFLNSPVTMVDPDGQRVMPGYELPKIVKPPPPPRPIEVMPPTPYIDEPQQPESGGYFPWPEWSNVNARQLYQDVATGDDLDAMRHCACIAKANPNTNVYDYSPLNLNRATGAFAVLWRKQQGQLARVRTPAWFAANASHPRSADRAHLIPRSYGGHGNYDNLVTVDQTTNQSDMKAKMDNEIDRMRYSHPIGEQFVCMLHIPHYSRAAWSAWHFSNPYGRPAPNRIDLTIVSKTRVYRHTFVPKPIEGDLAADPQPWNRIADQMGIAGRDWRLN